MGEGPLTVQSIRSLDSGINSEGLLSVLPEASSSVLPAGSVGPLLVQNILSIDTSIGSEVPSSVLSVGSEAPSIVKSDDLDNY